MKTYLRSVFLPLITLQILFKILNACLLVIYSRFIALNPAFFKDANILALSSSQLLLIISPGILFVCYKYFYKHTIPLMVVLMCILTSAIGLQWGNPVLLNDLRNTIGVLMEGIIFWQLALLATSEDQAKWFFPLYVLLVNALVMLMHQHWPFLDQIGSVSLLQIYGILAVLGVTICGIAYHLQSTNNIKLKIQENFMHSFGIIFTSPLFIGVLCVLIGSNIVHQLILSPLMDDIQAYVNGVGISFIALAILILPKDFLSKSFIMAGFSLWLIGLNIMGFQNIWEGLKQGNYKAMFILMWPTVVLYPLLYCGFLKTSPEERTLGFTYIILASFLLSRLFYKALLLI